jgi:hypothetical protein
MITKTLYSGKGYSYSTTATVGAKNTGLVRLIADDGKALTDGTITVAAIDTNDISKWTEITNPPEPIDPATLDPVALKVELDRYKTAVAEVTAINTSTALKTTLADAVNRLKTAVEVKTEPIVKEIVK